MIYQLYGFNYIYDGFIPSLSKYIQKKEDNTLPTIYISSTKRINEIDAENIFRNNVVDSYYTTKSSYTRINNGDDILVSKNHFIISGNKWSANSIGEEINGPSTIYASRFNNRAVLHGGAFYYNDKAYLIIALPGTGKSTLNSAINKYHASVTFLTDDIIAISSDGCYMYKGMQSVNLNDDSLENLLTDYAFTKNDLHKISDDEPKTNYTGKFTRNFDVDAKIKIGGVFFLDQPIQNGLIEIKNLTKTEFICEALRNVKIRNSLTSALLQQEMRIINQLANKVFAVRLNIIHDFSKLKVITEKILNCIDEYER